ncbi:two-component regulator propeller domain-containing protein [Flavivirga abyssicola]|uniref:two-component regulator propeller domain-containing protein n=1 Tax=Flavivirga abyssicola TaxID=3063533 RepID=UPI0026DEFEE1|nr:two-component regulator propeller domain-containing protein [Flavivirga sp. MEBiC07777]WVK14774.1 two-component regulator propeller domain-containing protein [Flavivirga sp. MEBiC07777]
MRKSFGIFIFILCCFLPEIYTSQNFEYFERITTDNGLSQSDINTIHQDKDGFMWFGTHDGLNKYDGYSFKIFNPDPNIPESITNNLIFDIEEDQNGNFWIGTTGGGLIFFDKSSEKFKTFTYDKNNLKSIDSNYIVAVYRDRENRLWIGTNKGLNMLNLENSDGKIEFQRFKAHQEPFLSKIKISYVNTIYQDSKGRIWTGGFAGLYKLARERNGEMYFEFINEKVGLPSSGVESISEDKEGRLILATDKGLFCQSEIDTSLKFKKITDGNFRCLLIDGDNIWAGSESGLDYFKTSSDKECPELIRHFEYDPTNPNSLSKNIITSLFKDKTGIVWIGTNGGGVNKFNPRRNQFDHVRKTLNANSLSYDKIRSFFEDSNGNLWIGTEGGGVNMKDKQSNDNTFLNFNAITNVFAIEEIKSGNKKKLLFGGRNLISLYELDITDPSKIKTSKVKPIKEISGGVFSILLDSNKTLWIGTYDTGIYRWTPRTGAGTDQYITDIFSSNPNDPSSISNNIIRNIYEDSKGNIWFATGNGLNKLTKEEASKKHPKFQVYKHVLGDETSISHNYILPIYESAKGELWIGTFGGGLNKFIPETENRSARFKSYSEKDGLPNNIIKGILEDDSGNLWLSTNKGLSMFNPEQETFKNYDVNDGLQSNEFQELACLKTSNNEMFFGGINGYNSFFPKNLIENTFEPETIITNFLISNEPVSVREKINDRVILKKTISKTQEIDLKYFENNISFEFAALHYAASQKNQFAYKLEGFERDWEHTTSNKRFASYTNLEPGIYTFYVKATNNDGLWDKTPTKIKISISPPYWLSNMAYFIYSLILVGLLIAFRKYTIINTNKKHQLELEHLEKEKSEELQQLKIEFFTNISHEIRTPLTLIKGPLEYLQQYYTQLEKKVVLQQFSLMQKNTDSLLRLVNQLLGFRKMDKGKMSLALYKSNIIEFVNELIEPFQFLCKKRHISIEIYNSENNITTWFDPNAVEKILNNLLSNAIKFTPDHGVIIVEVFNSTKDTNDEIKKELIIQVKDSGPGIKPEKIKYIFERFYVDKKSTKKQLPEGVGIGLSYSKKLAELHQGSLDVKSKPKKGSTFIFKIPMNKEDYLNIPNINFEAEDKTLGFMMPNNVSSYQRDINDEIIDKIFSKRRSKLPILLVVDDHSEIRDFISQTLNEYYNVYHAENGKEGLEAAKHLQPNIILTDIFMPVMDGFEFCKQLKTKQETSHIPVIMITAKASEESELLGFTNGADDYIRKPFNVNLLKLKLSNILEHREQLRKRFNRKIVSQPKDVTVTSADEKFLQQAIEIIEKHMMNTEFNVKFLVKEMNFSRSNIFMKFKELTGLSSGEFIRNIRLKRALQLLETSDLSVKEIMYMTGFNTASYFSKCFKKQFGVLPSEYIKKMKTNEKVNEDQFDK